MLTEISNSDLRVFVIPVHLMPGVYYYQTLGSSCMDPVKLQRHLHTEQANCKDKRNNRSIL